MVGGDNCRTFLSVIFVVQEWTLLIKASAPVEAFYFFNAMRGSRQRRVIVKLKEVGSSRLSKRKRSNVILKYTLFIGFSSLEYKREARRMNSSGLSFCLLSGVSSRSDVLNDDPSFVIPITLDSIQRSIPYSLNTLTLIGTVLILYVLPLWRHWLMLLRWV